MFVDARSLCDHEHIDADVCIVGGGPAGMTLAHEIGSSGVRVCVLESGGLGYDPAAHALSEGAGDGELYRSLREASPRGLGGATNLWDSSLMDGECGFRSGPLDDLDFEHAIAELERDTIALSPRDPGSAAADAPARPAGAAVLQASA